MELSYYRGYLSEIFKISKIMETVLLTRSPAYPDDLADTCIAVKLDDYFLCSGSALSQITYCYTEQEFNSCNFQTFRFYVIRSIEDQSEEFEIFRVYCKFVHRSQLIKTSFDQDFHDIECKDSHRNIKISSAILGTIFLFCENEENTNLEEAIRKIYDYILPINRRMLGCPVTINSVPYKNLLLFNSRSRGVIATVLGKRKCMFLTDTKLAVGCEGSPVLSIHGELIGLILSICIWCRGEWMGFSLAIHLHSVLKNWLDSSLPKIFFDMQERHTFIGDQDINSYGVVMVTTPHKWGSGIIMDKLNGIILTCSHVVNYSLNKGDVIVEYNKKSYIGKILYASPRGLPFDIAVIEVKTFDFNGVAEFKLPTRDCKEGEAVYVISYPLFSFKRLSIKSPSVTYGNVSKLHTNAMILTTCVSNSGSSGGALVRPNGELMGIVTNNVVVPDKNVLIPHITIAVPSMNLFNAVKQFSFSKDIKEFHSLTVLDKNVRDIWNLTRSAKFIKSKL